MVKTFYSIPIKHWQLVASQSLVTKDVLKSHYRGSGTTEDPFAVEWIRDDPRNPMSFDKSKKWIITLLVTFATLGATLVSSAYTGGLKEIEQEFSARTEVVTAGISLFVLGFGVGALLWAPLSEMFGRQIIFFVTFMALTAFNAGCAGSRNIITLLLLRFLAGFFGCSPLTNAGGVIADMFPPVERGLALSIFSCAPFFGPTLGPLVGGFFTQNKGWRWMQGLMAIITGALWILGIFLVPETYAPVLLRKRAAKLSKITGKVYISKLEADHGTKTLGHTLKVSLTRPWALLAFEPIVLLLSIFMAIVYGMLYLMFAGFPFIFQETYGWSEGVGGLAFLGVLVGMMLAVVYAVIDNWRYEKVSKEHHGFAPPESRLPPAMIGAVVLPVGIFAFAWTNFPSIHFMACIVLAAPFGFGMVLIFLGSMNYLIDSYTVYAASALASCSILRSIFGAAFPLFTTALYARLGIHWGTSVPAFLSLLCLPFPFIFSRYGAAIRERCKYSAQAKLLNNEIAGHGSSGLEVV